MNNPFTIYFAGSLFNHKDLTGNALLAEYIEKCSDNKYRCCLPQNEEQHQTTALDIRNKDIVKLIECDLGLFSFDGTELDAGRLEQEAALLADRADVTEELVRLGSHLEQLAGLFGQPDGDPLGKRLEFLLQEVHRENNTIGSKSADLELSRLTIEMKTELEKVREQIQNLE